MKICAFFKILLPILFLALLGAWQCGGSVLSTSVGLGDGNLGPNPEDVFDLPNQLPDSFLSVSCPDTGGSRMFDLRVVLEVYLDANARQVQADFDGDGTQDNAILIKKDDPAPGDYVVEAFHVDGAAYNVSEVDFTPALTGISFGYEFDENMVSQEDGSGDLAQSFGSALLTASWNVDDPLFRQIYFDVNFPPDPNFPNAPIVLAGGDWENSLAGGVHIVAARFTDNQGDRHCTTQVFRILVCPVAGHCDADANPI